jgi:polyhydroxybutyrate depolymerase
MRILILSVFLIVITGFAVAQECVGQTPCQLNGRGYYVKVPDDWDGITPMPVMLHFHGWGRQGGLIVKHTRISGATRRRGVLLLAPNGQGKTWNFWSAGSPDTAFADAVIEDAAKRYPIDRSRIFISGYSYGSAMAWRYACETKIPIAALLAVSGVLDQSETCPSAPKEIRQVYGLKDTVMGFPFGPNGETTYPVKLWRARKGCTGMGYVSGSWSVTKKDTFTRTNWENCADGGSVRLDVHKRGHFIPVGWIGRQLDELLGLVTAP